ncbi:MAG: Zn-ribbon domain-containing OB-fold protein [Dehalococcoidia bacterium]
MEKPPLGNIAFSRFLREGRVMGSKCCSCGSISIPPRPFCNECFSDELVWSELEGRGKLESFTCTAVCPPSMAARGYSAKKPYCVGVVKLEEGVRVVALIDGIDESTPESIEIGMPLQVSYSHMSDDGMGTAYLVFVPS